ncbi:hypothetical protein [Nannocystis punicea]|uniref:Type II secretion system protein GspE N-terminal domain-containing protein n=1 Tax=Nannocystis punicea TaxID=2995304 RepID=A0ABY7HFW3_9BACT|nr:hypothetical protein [Nannocystis poenicansa]WAS98186.1 hypothetical protein O0S08_18760 [Nannocystis poenicansa]
MSLLLRHLEANGPLSRADLEAASRRQQQAGGSLDTAILELGLMTPLQLDALLQSACGLPGAPVRLLERGPIRPWEHVPRDLVDIGWAMPLAQEDGRLIVAVHPDLPDAKLGQLYRMVRGFYPVVAPECCLAKIAAERTGSILAPRYALILLDYLEALRSASITISLVPGAGTSAASEVPVPADRQPEAAGAGAAVPADRQADARAADAPVLADMQGLGAGAAGAAVPADSHPSDSRGATAADGHAAGTDVAGARPAVTDRQAPAPSPAEGSAASPADDSADRREAEAPRADEHVLKDRQDPAQVAARLADAPVPADRQAAGASLSLADAADVPIPADRQLAGPRPAAMSGPSVAARATGAAAPSSPANEAAAATDAPSSSLLRSIEAAERLRSGTPAAAVSEDRSVQSREGSDDFADDSSIRPRPAATAESAPPTVKDAASAAARAEQVATGGLAGSTPVSADRSDVTAIPGAPGREDSTAAAKPVLEDSTHPAATETSSAPGREGRPAVERAAGHESGARDTEASRAANDATGSTPVSSDSHPAPRSSSSTADEPSASHAEPAPTPAAPAANRQTAAYDSRAPESAADPAGAAPTPVRPRMPLDAVPVAPDAPLIAPRGFDGAADGGVSLSALAIAPDTPLIILPPVPTTRPGGAAASGAPGSSNTSSGHPDRRTLVGIPVGAAPTAPAPHGPSNGVAHSTITSSTPAPSPRADEPSASPVVARSNPPAPSPRADEPSASHVVARSNPPVPSTRADEPSASHVVARSSTPVPSTRADEPSASHVVARSSTPVPSTRADEPSASHVVARPGAPVPSTSSGEPSAAHVIARSLIAPGTPVPSTSSEETAGHASGDGLVEPSTRRPPAPPQPMVMTLAQRLDAARSALATARERDRITEALVRASALIAPRVALFGVKREGLRVLSAPGSALRLAEGLVIPLPEGGLLDRAVSGQGPLHLLIEPSLSFAVGQPLGIPCVFEPVLAGGRTVLMLYVDRAGVAFDPRERTVLRELCDTARQSLEALLRLLGWVVPGGTPGAGPADRSRPSVRPHLASPIVTVDDSDPPATTPPEPEDSPSPSPVPAAAAAEPAAPADSEEPEAAVAPTTGGVSGEPGFGDSTTAAGRSRGRSSSRGRAVITLKNPIRRDEPATVTPLPIRAESSTFVRAQSLVEEPPAATEEDYEDSELDDEPEPDDQPARRDGPGLGLAPVPVPLGPENGQDSPLVARFAAMFSKPATVPTVTIDLSDRPGTFGHGHTDTPSTPPASPPQPDMPGWIAAAESSGIEDPLPVAAALRAAATGGDARADHDPASTLPGAPRVLIEEAARGAARDEFDDWPRAASDTPTILDLSPPPTHAPLLVETRAAPDAKTVLDIPPLDAAVPPETLIPNLIAPPGSAGAGRRRRTPAPVEEEPVLVIPKTLRRSSGLTATPHPMARRSDPDEAEGGPTLSMPTTLIGPRSGRRRGKNEPRPEAPTDALTMPRLVRDAEADDEAATSSSEHVVKDMSDATGSEAQAAEHVAEDRPAAETAAAKAAAGPAPAADDPDESAAVADAAPAGALSDREIDAVIEDFLQNPAEWTSVSRLRALDERGLARLAARFPGPIDLANATNFPPPSAHGPLLRACVELGHAVSPHVLALFASVRPQIRFYAAFLFQELRDPRCLRPLGELAFDSDPDVRLIATRVLESYSRVPDFAAVAAEIRAELDSQERDRQLLAVEAAGTLRDTLAVPRLIDLLAVRDKHVREAALEALCSITAKHHGYRAQRWRAWYAEHGQEPRIEWVIDGLRHRDEAVRRWAADELARITGQRIPFPAEGDRRSRDLALRAWQAWWDSNREDFTAGS